MKNIKCAICQTEDNYRVLYPERIDPAKINFSARRPPGRMHFRFVKCRECDLIYSNPIFPDNAILDLYKESRFIDEPQLENMGQDYLRELKRVIPYLQSRENLLEIGCGNGFFLNEAKSLGFKNVHGVEPGMDAVNQAAPEIRGNIINDVFTANLFPENFFDVVCLFQVFDHLLAPDLLLQDVYKVLKPGGVFLAINHNVRSFLTRVLGENSSMFDVEHIYLFDKSTMRKILERNGFNVLNIQNCSNGYMLGYGVKMFPMPASLKKWINLVLDRTTASNMKIRLPAGNMVSIAKKIA